MTDVPTSRNYFPAVTEGDDSEILQLYGLISMLKTIRHYVEALGLRNGYNTIMDQLEAMKRFHNSFTHDPRYNGVETKWFRWIDNFSQRFVRELHEELETFVTANPKMREVKLGSFNFYEMVKGIQTYTDYSTVQNRVRLWFDKYDERPTEEQYDCSIFLSSFLHEEKPYANIVPQAGLENETKRIDLLITEAQAKLAVTTKQQR